MRYKRLLVRDFRGIEEQEIVFAEGITIVVGPNEAGKSSVREALEMLRRYKDSSRAGAVKEIVPIGRDAAPFVEAELVTGPYGLTYRKRWIRQPLTELEVRAKGRPPQTFTGGQAHDKFIELLKETADVNLLDQVNVAQGESLQQPQLASVTALQTALGKAPESGEAEDLMEAVDKEFLVHHTPGGRPGVQWRELQQEVTDLTRSLAQSQARRDETDELAARRAAGDENLRRLRDLQAQEKPELEAAEKAEDERRRRAEELQELIAAADREVADLERLEASQVERADLAEQIAALTQQVEGDRAAVEAAEAVRGQERTARAEVENVLRQWEAKSRELRQESQRRQTRATLRAQAKELLSVEGALGQAQEAQEALTDAEADLAAAKISDSELQGLLDLDAALNVAEAAWRAGAPTVTVRRLGDHPVEVTGVEGAQQVGEETFTTEVFDSLKVAVAGIVEVEVGAGGSPERLQSDLLEARQAFEDALESLSVGSLEEARLRNVERRQREALVATRRAVFEEASRSGSVKDLRARQAVLLSRLIGEDAATLAGQGQALEEELRAARAAEEAAEEEAETLREKLDAARDEETRAEVALAEAREAATESQTKMLGLTARSEVLAAKTSDEELQAAIEAAKEAAATSKQRTEALRAKVDSVDAQAAQAHLENLRQLRDRRLAEVRQAQEDNLALDAVLRDRDREGLFDQVQDLEAELRRREGELARRAAQAAAVARLREVLLRHQDLAQQSYVAPFKAGIDRLGKMLFGPDFAVHVDSDLQITSRTLDGVDVPFESLSVGAKEQLALLGRLVAADLIDPGEGAPLILDDALGFADPQRLRDLNMILNRVGQDAQIIVLTCDGKRFDRVGSAEVVQF